jgi:hypothetical protein
VFWANQVNKVGGVALLAVPLLSVLAFAGAGPMAEIDPFSRGDVEAVLRYVHDDRALFISSIVPFIVTDLLLLPTIATVFYIAFRDRSHLLALLAAFSIIVSATASMVHEVASLVLPFLAADYFVEGGASGVAVGDLTILQSARTVSILQGMAALCGQSALGFGVGSLGVLLLGAPQGQWNPPAWLGTVGVLAAAGMLSTWIFLLSHTAGGIATLVAEAATIVMVVGLGIWFLRQPDAALSTAGVGAS